MTKKPIPARQRILAAANQLFYDEGIRAVSVDAVAEKAGVTKKTLYYHFKSKDDLIAAYLESRDQPNLNLFRKWFDNSEGPFPDRVCAIFKKLEKAAKRTSWKGCGFLRTAAELANQPGHPAIKVGANHKKKFEIWLEGLISEEGLEDSKLLARQILVLMDGAFSSMLIHRDPVYISAAGAAAKSLLELHINNS